MKYFLFFLYWFCIAFVSKAQNSNFEIYGVLKGLGNKKVLLGNKPNGYTKAYKLKFYDSCFASNDSFYFSGRIEYPDYFSIEIEVPESEYHQYLSFIIDTTKIFIRGNADSVYDALVIGSRENDEYYDPALYRRESNITERRNPIVVKLYAIKHGKSDSSKKQILIDSLNAVMKDAYSNLYNLIKTKPGRFVSLAKLIEYRPIMVLDSMKKYYLLLTERLKNSPKGRALYYDLFREPNLIEKRNVVPVFFLTDTNGNEKSIESFRGKYVLLDFWASWCGPCIAEFPSLASLYKKYKPQGFEILGISLDIDKGNWLKAVKEHNIIWKTFCDLQGAESKPYKIFSSNKIPFLVLIDREGKILSIDPNLKELESELEKIFNPNG